jgi:hypothetical protein
MGSSYAPDWRLHAVNDSITKARSTGQLTLDALLNALSRIQKGSHDYASAEHARELAAGLRSMLTIDELVGLCREAERALTNEAERTACNLEEVLSKNIGLVPQSERGSVPLLQISVEQDDSYLSPLIIIAVVLQALAWVVRPPLADEEA